MYNINRDKLIQTFTELAEISSPSWKEDQVMKYIIRRFKKSGAQIKKYPCGDSHNLLIKIKGNSPGPSIMLSGHMDTVEPCEKVTAVVGDRRITSDGTSVLGGDDKAAIAMFIEALEYARENNIKHGPVEILLSCAEEVGLKGIKGFDLSVIESDMAFVFDSGGSIGSIVVMAPYHSNMTISVTGKASHAGMAPEKGINAIKVISEIISSIPAGKIDDETSLNVGLISGGRATNIVPDRAQCSLEIRSMDRKKMVFLEKRVKEEVKKICSANKAKASIERTLEYAGFSLKEDSEICRITAQAMKKIKIKPQFKAMGGGSDTNIINSPRIKAVNLSCGMQKIHSTEEFILISDLEKGTKLVLSIMETIQDRQH